MPASPRKPRYRLADFTISPSRRLLVRGAREVPLIPRYFDLLLLLVERRGEAVHRRDILDAVWRDVVVSDGALSQAVRTLRRALGDDPREPGFIRTVSRHGYEFVHPAVVEEPDDAPLPSSPQPRSLAEAAASAPADPLEDALSRLLGPGDDDERREAAETLHALGTAEALRRLDRRPGHAQGRALLRDARWDVAGAGDVPLVGSPALVATLLALARLRLRRVRRLAATRSTAAAGGGAMAGIVAGLLGGIALKASSGPQVPASVPVALALVGAAIGGVGALGVGAGLAAAEALVRSSRATALVLFGALGGGAVGAISHVLGRWTLEGLFGHELSAVGGGFEGVLLGGTAGLGYALSTPRPSGGMATPRGASRFVAALVTGLCCSAGAMALAWMGGNLGGVSLDYMARQFQGSQVGLAPLARVFGESELGPVTRTVLSAYEGLSFGFGLALGLTRRPGAV